MIQWSVRGNTNDRLSAAALALTPWLKSSLFVKMSRERREKLVSFPITAAAMSGKSRSAKVYVSTFRLQISKRISTNEC